MAIYVYEGINTQGQRKKGTIRAHSQINAHELIKKKKIKPLVVNEQAESLANREINFFNKVSTKLLVGYLQQFAILISSGVSVLQSSEMLASQK